MANSRVETVIELPWDIVDECNGFAVDIGGSVLKCAYIHKDDWIPNPADRKQDTCPIRLVNFAIEEMEKSFDYLSDRMFIKRNTAEDTPLIYTTGIGGSQFMSQIKEHFKVKCENLTEMDLFIQSHHYLLKSLSREKLVYPFSNDGIEKARSEMKDILGVVDKMQSEGNRKTAMEMPHENIGTSFKFLQEEEVDGSKRFTEYEDIFPCMLVVLGSGGSIMLLNKDGTFRVVEGLTRVGRTFYGLGSLLTGAKSFDELMELAANGTDKNVHTYTSDLGKGMTADDDSVYSAMAESTDYPCFLFGKGVRKIPSDFKREDLARALAHTFMADVAQVAHMQTYRFPAIRHVFFCGNFVSHPLMRTLLTTEWLKRDTMNKLFFASEKDAFIDIHILQHGAHYGSLGALLNYKMKFTEKMGEMAAKATANRKAEDAEKIERATENEKEKDTAKTKTAHEK